MVTPWSGWYSASVYGPVQSRPRVASVGEAPSSEAVDMITACAPASRPGIIGDGAGSSNTTVLASGAVMAETAPLKAAPMPADSRKRSSEATTSAEVTAERVAALFAYRGVTQVTRYELPRLAALNFVIEDALEGGVNSSLGLDTHGKCLSYLVLGMDVRVPIEPGDGREAEPALQTAR